jgi:hypothetical protein
VKEETTKEFIKSKEEPLEIKISYLVLKPRFIYP